jgi:DNA-binding transcriptional MerR regulator
LDKSPDAFRTISEAAEELDLPQHVLRFWETRFSTIKPLKRGGGRRYYRPEDVQLLKGIRHLLYDQGFTIKGVQKILKDQGSRHVAAIGGGSAEDLSALGVDDGTETGEVTHETAPHQINGVSATTGEDRERLGAVLRELLDLKRILDRARE